MEPTPEGVGVGCWVSACDCGVGVPEEKHHVDAEEDGEDEEVCSTSIIAATRMLTCICCVHNIPFTRLGDDATSKR